MEKYKANVSGNKVARYLWITLGLISFAIGTVGIFLPILPTFPFYLLTLIAFAKGSERLHKWFIESNFYKNNIKEFLETKMLTIKSKVSIIMSLSIFMGMGAYFMHYTWSRLLLGAVWLGHVVYLGFIIKTKKN